MDSICGPARGLESVPSDIGSWREPSTAAGNVAKHEEPAAWVLGVDTNMRAAMELRYNGCFSNEEDETGIDRSPGASPARCVVSPDFP